MSKPAFAHSSGFLSVTLLVCVLLPLKAAAATQLSGELSPRLRNLIRKAGNAARDDVRMAHLRNLRKQFPDSSSRTRC